VKIDHPDLPDAMKQVAAEAVLSIWQAASEAAAGQLAALRAEARQQAHEAEVVRNQAAAEFDVVRQTVAATQAELEATCAQLTGMRDALAAEREAHAATNARLQVSMPRALREIDQERTARHTSEKQIEELPVQLQMARAELKDTAVQHAEAFAALRIELRLSQRQSENAAQQLRATTDELVQTRSLLRDTQRRAELADAEVQVTRRLVDGLKKAPAGRGAPKQKTA